MSWKKTVGKAGSLVSLSTSPTASIPNVDRRDMLHLSCLLPHIPLALVAVAEIKISHLQGLSWYLLWAHEQILQGLLQVQATGNNLHTHRMHSSKFTFLSWQNHLNSQGKQLWCSEDYLCLSIPCFPGPLPPSQQHQTNFWNRAIKAIWCFQGDSVTWKY